MTTDQLGSDTRTFDPSSAHGGEATQTELSVPSILSLLDRQLDEVGRRRHLFAWLRPPGSDPDAWLPVEAYYPRNRLVVVCHAPPGKHDHLFAELVPLHGLRLLQFRPSELGSDPAQAQQTVARLVSALSPTSPEGTRKRPAAGRAPAPTRPATSQAPSSSRATAAQGPAPNLASSAARTTAQASPTPAAASAPAWGSATSSTRVRRSAQTATRPARTRATRVRPPRGHGFSSRRDGGTRSSALATQRQHFPARVEALGVAVGLAVALALCAELYFGGVLVALDAGRVLFAGAIALDVCSRSLGSIAAVRYGSAGWAAACVVFGSPLVVAFVFLKCSGSVRIEPAPLAGLTAALAITAAIPALLLAA